MKRILSFALILTLAVCLFSFAASAEEKAATRIVTDLAGNEVEVPAAPERIAVLPDALSTLSWILMGGGDRMACVTKESKGDWENYLGHELYPDMAEIPAGAEQNVEELMTLDPDLIITMSGDYYADLTNAYVEMGYPVFVVTSEALYGDPVACITTLGDLYGCEDRAAQLVNYMEETDAYVAEKMASVTEAGKRLYNCVWVNDMKAWTAGSFNGKIIKALNCENISDAEGSSTAFTMEEILAYDPEIVIISFNDYTTNDFYNNAIPGQDWSTVSAVKNHSVYRSPVIAQRWAQSFSTEKFLYKRWMASVVYPEVFPMAETVEYIKDYLKDFHGYEISDEALSVCLNSEENGL